MQSIQQPVPMQMSDTVGTAVAGSSSASSTHGSSSMDASLLLPASSLSSSSNPDSAPVEDSGKPNVSSAAPAPASVSASEPTAPAHDYSIAEGARVAELLLYYYDLSDHVVRENTCAWEHAGLGGLLVTEWQPESGRYRIPCSLLWAWDGQAAAARNDDPSLAKHLVDMPLLPYWTISVDGDGNCLMRALILSDVAAKDEQLTVPIWDAMLSLERDAVYGIAKDKTAERSAIMTYRQTYVHLRARVD
jgi:hypothetical protein